MTIDVSLAHRFGRFSLDASFHIAQPGVTTLFGPSGAGKTTIVHAVAGLLHPNRGRISVDGEILLDTDARIFVPARRRRMGYVFQDSRLFPHLTVEGNLRFGSRRAKKAPALPRFHDIVDLLGLGSLLMRRPATLSGGEKSRVALGRALLAGPRILLLDEPLAALDAKRKSEIMPYLERLRDFAELPMIYVTHSVEEVVRLADNLIVLHNGMITAQGSVFDLLSDPSLGALLPTHAAVFSATVAEQQADGLTALAFDGGVLLVPRLERPLHTKLRVRLHADDVILAREPPRQISANNVLPVRIAAATFVANGTHVEIRLRCGGVKFMARITCASFNRLALHSGQDLYAIVKSVVIDPQTSRFSNGTD